MPESPLRGAQLIGVPDPLSSEIQEILGAAYLRGALACGGGAELSPDRELTFLSSHKAQRAVAAKLGFTI